MKLATIADLARINVQHLYYKLTGQRSRIIPYKAVVEITTQCNSKCLYCDIWKIKKENLQKIDLAQFELFLKKMDKHLLWLALTGGEISSYNQFPMLVDLIKKLSPRLRILTFTTNGLLPQRILEFAQLMKREVGCDIFITISLDGDEQVHDEIRGIKGNYAKCMETYDLLIANDIECHFGITVAEGNHEFIKNSFRKYRDKIKAVTFMHTGGIFLTADDAATTETYGRIADSMETIYKEYKVSALGEILVRWYIKLGVLFLRKGRKTNVIPCDVGLSSAHIMANGDLHPCMYLPPIKKLSEGFELSDYHQPEVVRMLEEVRRDRCPHCWMSCYGPHSMLQAPVSTLVNVLKPLS